MLFFICKILFKTSIHSPFRRFFYVLESLNTTLDIIKFQPDLIIVSLWKSCLSAIFIKLLRPNTKIILFIHLPNSVHLIDYFSNFLISKLANQIWGDSDSSLKARYEELAINKNKKSRVISFLTHKLVQNKNYEYKPILFSGEDCIVKKELIWQYIFLGMYQVK